MTIRDFIERNGGAVWTRDANEVVFRYANEFHCTYVMEMSRKFEGHSAFTAWLKSRTWDLRIQEFVVFDSKTGEPTRILPNTEALIASLEAFGDTGSILVDADTGAYIPDADEALMKKLGTNIATVFYTLS